MNTPFAPEVPQFQWHFTWLLLPYMLGIYAADYRNFTDYTSLFFSLLTFCSLMLIIFKSTRQFGLLFSFLVFGFWSFRIYQGPFCTDQKQTFNREVIGYFTPHSIEKKQNLQSAIGRFYYRQNNISKSVSLQIYIDSNPKINTKQVFAIRCKPRVISNESYPGAFDQSRYFELKGVSHRAAIDDKQFRILDTIPSDNTSRLFRFKNKLSKLFNKTLSRRSAAICRALILGERDGIDAQIRSYFLATGSMHILAVSGMHIGLLIGVLLQILELFSQWLNRRNALIVVVSFVWCYAILTGLSASVLRSSFMFSILLLSQFSGRQISQLNALFFSAFCLLLYNPLYLFDLGFQLSYTAMLGIYLFYNPIKSSFLFRWRLIQHIWEGIALSISATITTLPLCLYHFHLYPNYAQIANVCLMSLSSFILVVGMCYPFFQSLPFLERISTYILETAIEWMLGIMRIFSEAPGALAKGFVLPFWWVLTCWIAGYFIFHGKNRAQRLGAQLMIFFCILYMTQQRYYKARAIEFSFYQKEKLLLYRKGSKALAFGLYPKEKYAFLFATLELYHNCTIVYKPIKKGRNRLVFDEAVLEMNHQSLFELQIRAQNQSSKMKVY